MYITLLPLVVGAELTDVTSLLGVMACCCVSRVVCYADWLV